MPYTLTVDSDLLRIDLSGTLTIAELGRYIQDLEACEARLDRMPHHLTDVTALTIGDLKMMDLFAFAQRRKAVRFKNDFKSALVVSNDLNNGFARMFQTLNNHPQIEISIFTSADEALAWLRDPAPPKCGKDGEELGPI